jgi:TolQ protein
MRFSWIRFSLAAAVFAVIAACAVLPARADDAPPAVNEAVTQQAPAADAATAPAPVAPVRFDVVAMVMHADVVVQAVMAFLALCSIATWTILIEKSVLLGRARRLSAAFLRTFRSSRTVGDVSQKINGDTASPAARMWRAAKAEWDLFHSTHPDKSITVHQADGLVQRMSVAATIAQETEMLEMSKSMGILATIGSTAPFIGLFGTVWGILTSFVGIAATKATSLSAVAPGIAEALLATAIGLVAAIPAVMIYNKFARQISQVSGMLDNFQAELTTVVSRELDVVG